MHGCGPAACCRPGAAEHTERLRLRQRGRPRPRAGLRRECRCSRVPVESSGPMRISCGHRSPASGRARTDVRRLRAAGESPQAMSEATAALLPRGMHPPKRMGVGNTRGTRRGARPPGAGAAGRVRGATEHEARGRVAGEPRTPRMRSGAPAKATGSSMAPPGPRYRAGPQTKRGARAAGDSNDEEIMKHAKKHADDLIEMLATAIEAQSAPWQKPWKCDARLPTNLITGKVYTGRNLLMLATVRALKAYERSPVGGIPADQVGRRPRPPGRARALDLHHAHRGRSASSGAERRRPRPGERRLAVRARAAEDDARVHVHDVPTGMERVPVREHRTARGGRGHR